MKSEEIQKAQADAACASNSLFNSRNFWLSEIAYQLARLNELSQESLAFSKKISEKALAMADEASKI